MRVWFEEVRAASWSGCGARDRLATPCRDPGESVSGTLGACRPDRDTESVNPSDEDHWRAIDQGRRKPTWVDLIGDPEAADHLSREGRALVPRMADDLTAFFGDEWLPTVLNGSDGPTVPALMKMSPVFSIFGRPGRAGSFALLAQLWAATTTQLKNRGARTVQKDVRSDHSQDRFLHTFTMLRLGSIAESCGAKVEYEPTPGDVKVEMSGQSLTLEAFAMGTGREVETQAEAGRRMSGHLRGLEQEYDVHFRGSMPDLDVDIDDWHAETQSAAELAGRLRISICLAHDGRELVVEPGRAPVGTELEGPTIEAEVGRRIHDRVRTKALQVSAASAAWLWVENHGAIDMLTPIYHRPLVEQVRAFGDLTLPALSEVPSVQGLTFSTSGRRTYPLPPREDVRIGNWRGCSQPVQVDRVRTSIHLPAKNGWAAELAWSLVDREPLWLTWALDMLDVGGTIRDLVACC